MRQQERRKLPLLMALHLLWGVVLWFSISKYGPGVSTDAVHLLFGGQNLAAGNGLTTYDGSFIALWPPLYPALLAMVRLITGVDMLSAATIVQAVAFLGLGISLSLLFLRIFPGRIIPAAAALVLTQAGAVVVATAGMVGSDYFHLFLAVLVVLLAARYVESGSRALFRWLAVAAMLVTLQRYLGLAATATAIAAVAVLSRTNWRRRLGDAIVLALTAVPMAVWLAITSQTYTRRGPITFEENFSRFSVSVLEWFVGPTSRKADVGAEQVVLWAAVAALTATALFFTRRDPSRAKEATQPEEARQVAWPYVRVLLLYGLLYVLALFGSASMAYFNKLEGRFILPLFVPLMALPVIAADAVVRAARRPGRMRISYALAIIGALGVMGLGLALLRTTYPAVMESRGRGVVGGENSFNNEWWHENPVVRYWREHTPTVAFLLFSNEPDGVTFHTWHAVEPAPRRISGPYGKDVMPVEEFADELFGHGLDAYLIWIEPSSYDYYYAPQELEVIAEMESLLHDDGGSIFRLSPKGEN